MPAHACVLCMQAKQGTELVGRKVFLRSTRPGRVEAAGEDSSAADTPADTAAAAAPAVAEVPAAAASSAGSNTQPSALVLFGECMAVVDHIISATACCMLRVPPPALVAIAYARQQQHA